jgi:hypothetical protein
LPRSTTVKLKPETKRMLARLGNKDDTYDEIIRRCPKTDSSWWMLCKSLKTLELALRWSWSFILEREGAPLSTGQLMFLLMDLRAP